MFDIGEIVSILKDSELYYTTYQNYFKHHNIEHLKKDWVYNEVPNEDSIFQVIFKGKHEAVFSMNEEDERNLLELCIIKDMDSKQIFIIQNSSEALRSNIIMISIPPDTAILLDQLKDFFKENSPSAIISLGIETLHWIKVQHNRGFIIQAEKEEGGKSFIKEMPIAGLYNK